MTTDSLTSNSSPPPKRTIGILGAGITGLQTALSILRSTSSPTSPPHPSSSSSSSSRVVIIAAHLPGDESIEYTSPWAGGHWRSHAHSSPDEAEIRAWDERTYREWRRLLAPSAADVTGPGEGNTAEGRESAAVGGGEAVGEGLERELELGLGVRESVMYWSEETAETCDADGAGLWWRDVVSGFRVLSGEELARASSSSASSGEGYQQVIFGARYDTVCINVPRYLSYLRERITDLGGAFIRATVRTDLGLQGVVSDVQRLVATHVLPSSSNRIGPSPEPPSQELTSLVLATGLLSRKYLPQDQAEKLYPVRGQTVLVKGEAPRAVTHLFPGGEISYVIPRPGSGTTILGGCKEGGNWDPEEDTGLTERILGRARGLVPELLRGRGGEGEGEGGFEVLSVQVGRRPGRKGGPRIDVEKEVVSGVRVVYAYGHEGAGYQNSVGSAEKVVRLLAQ